MACRWPADAAAAEAVAVAAVVAAVEAAAVAEAVVAAESGSAESGSAVAESALPARVVQVAPPAACPGVRAACAESHGKVAAEIAHPACLGLTSAVSGGRHGALDGEDRRNSAGELSRPRQCGVELRRHAQGARAHRLLSRAQPVVSGAIRSCRGQGARPSRRSLVSGHHRSRPASTKTAEAAMSLLSLT